jgi:hypothetical protein
MTKKEEMILSMEEYCEVTISVECQNEKCNKYEQGWCVDEESFTKEIYKKGWRIKNDELLCPKCSKNTKPI